MVADARPGQLWRWAFIVGNGTWFCDRVSTEARTRYCPSVLPIHPFDVFTVVATDDPGPFQLVAHAVNDDGTWVVQVPKRWHVVLLKGVLVWFEHPWLEQSELVHDVS